MTNESPPEPPDLDTLMQKYPSPTLHLLPLRERPVYRVAEAGAEACSLVELLAAVVGGPQQVEIAYALLDRFGDVAGLGRASVHELQQVPGLGPAGAARLKAALELGQRLSPPGEDRPRVGSPADAAHLLMPRMRLLEQEELWVVILDVRNRVLGVEMVYRGNLSRVVARPCEVFRSAIRAGTAAAIIVAHNHPSGDGSPSPEDVAVTKTLVQSGELLGLEVLDHLILAGDRFVSLRERGLGFW